MFARFDELAQRAGIKPGRDRRRADRTSAQTAITVRSMHGESAAAVVRDVSPFGCSLVFEAEWRRTGMIVRLVAHRGERIDAVVRWLDDESCGVEFLRQVPDAEARLGGA